MRSHLTPAFRRLFAELPAEVQKRARQSYEMWKADPAHPSVGFKHVHPRQPIYSVRAGLGWRALGLRQDDTIIWFWIGSHAEYDRLLKRL